MVLYDTEAVKFLQDLERGENKIPAEEVTKLNLNGTPIAALPAEIGQLTSLVRLNLSETPMAALPAEIVQLTNLKSLYLSRTRIEELPAEIVQLTNLVRLDLDGTRIEELPAEIGRLTNLKYLYLSRTPIAKLPAEIGQLKNLERLDLNSTKITELPSAIGNLKKLKKLDLSNLRLKKLPKALCSLNLDFAAREGMDWFHADSGINLRNTTLATQPISLFLNNQRELIQEYFDQLEQDKVTLQEGKVIFLGDGGVGKTYTIKRMLNGGKKDDYKTDTTPGIDITIHRIAEGDTTTEIKLWDFGGQEIMHSMHRCFLTGRTCYVVLVSNRKEDLTGQAEEMLRNINSFTKDCPVILAINRDNDSTETGINMPYLKSQYPNIVGHYLSFSAKCSEKEEFDQLEKAIVRIVREMDSVGLEFPRQWANIRAEIEKKAEDKYYIDQDEYRKICKDNGLTDPNIRRWLLEWFNDLGVCFSYHQENGEELMQYQLLNPKWLTNALYLIINQGRFYAENGSILQRNIGDILNSSAVAPKDRVFPEYVSYSRQEQQFVMDIMRKFRLSYPIDERFEFIPAICPDETPKGFRPAGYCKKLSMELKYTYLPDTIIHRMMVQCREYLNRKKSWRKGMRLNLEAFGLCAAADYKPGDKTTLILDVFETVEKPGMAAWRLMEYLRGNVQSINRELGMTAEETILYQVKDGIIELPVKQLLSFISEGIPSNYFYCEEAKKNVLVNFSEVIGERFGENTKKKIESRGDSEKAREESAKILRDAMASAAEKIQAGFNTVIQQNEQVIQQNEQVIQQNDRVIQQNDRVIQQNEQVIQQNDRVIKALEQETNSELKALLEELKKSHEPDTLQTILNGIEQGTALGANLINLSIGSGVAVPAAALMTFLSGLVTLIPGKKVLLEKAIRKLTEIKKSNMEDELPE